jgi:hypothetical protein
LHIPLLRREESPYFSVLTNKYKYSETSTHRFYQGSEKETIDAGAIVDIGFAQGP